MQTSLGLMNASFSRGAEFAKAIANIMNVDIFDGFCDRASV